MTTVLGLSFTFAGLLEILIPLMLGFMVIRRFGTSWKIFWAGCLMFVISLIRIPLNGAATIMILSSGAGDIVYTLLVLFSSVTAGLFEETARYLGYRYIVKDHSYENGVTFGVGHGGIESILTVGVNVLSIGLLLLTNPNSLPASQLQYFSEMPVYMPLIGLYERLLAITAQIGLSVMVLESFRLKDIKYYIIAVALHISLDFVTSIFMRYGVWQAEMILTGFALGIGYWTVTRLFKAGIIK